MSHPLSRSIRRAGLLASLPLAGLTPGLALAHGDVTPQAVDTKALPELGDAWAWRPENPFHNNDTAVKIRSSAYNQNCARRHGLEAISGGIAPDLRKLDNDCAPMQRRQEKNRLHR